MSEGGTDKPDPADDIDEIDPGLARERTELAWTRSSIAFAALGLAIVKFRPAVGIPILTFGVVVWWAGHLPRSGTAGHRVLLVTVAVVALALAALLLTLLGHDDQGLRP